MSRDVTCTKDTDIILATRIPRTTAPPHHEPPRPSSAAAAACLLKAFHERSNFYSATVYELALSTYAALLKVLVAT
jgi:hypothetical protein